MPNCEHEQINITKTFFDSFNNVCINFECLNCKENISNFTIAEIKDLQTGLDEQIESNINKETDYEIE
ncbi:hypothetical protein [Spiroplasma chrysopicola]|uniref:Uncharacterized protein n=1 Tax=Spiroplasma chrysopicola DF-1 TaxID=1276227 RepID=R4U4I7_9MOLU|nr:hypothetical protein [Spiroplasma chrysopicola]AGM25483.1 hypothetical protein SCHRY_v1c09100 [Spiroplasma chrysopicola DF-1]